MGCGTPSAYAYYSSFYTISTILVLNLFVAMLLTASEKMSQEEDMAISKYQTNDILKEWSEFDPEATGFIDFK